MSTRLSISLAGLFLLAATGHSFAATHQWSKSFGDAVDQIATAVVVDNSGAVIVVGRFDGSFNLGGALLTSAGPSVCTYMVKFDQYGYHVWSKVLGDTMEYSTNKIGVDVYSNVYIASDFNGSLDFGGGAVVADGFRAGVIAKLDASGNHVWSRAFGGADALVEVEAAAVDGSGNMVVVGRFTGTVDFGGGATLKATWFDTNVFIVKFNAGGEHVWSRRYLGDLIVINSIAVDAGGNVVMVGNHGGTFDFGGGALTADLLNVFMAAYDSNGGHRWSHSFGDAATSQHVYDVALDLSGNAFITGHFSAPLNLGGGYLNSAGSSDVYLAKFDGSGNHVWSQRFGDGNAQRSFSVATDASGNAILSGHFFGSIDFGGGPLTSDPLDFFVARFGPTGNYIWSEKFDAFNLGIPNDKDYAIMAASNLSGDIAFAGTFKDAVTCGGGNLPGFGAWDMFVTSYTLSATAADSPSRPATMLAVFPNPFNPQTTLTYTTVAAGVTQLHIYSVNGKLIKALVDKVVDAGEHTAMWNGRDDHGRPVASGVYFARLKTLKHVSTRRVVLLK